MGEEISDEEYIKTLETNNALLKQLLESERALKESFKGMFEDSDTKLSQLMTLVEQRRALEGKTSCFVPKDKKTYTEEEIAKFYGVR